MRKKKQFSFKGRMRSFSHAFRGIKILVQTQHNARIHAAIGFAVILLSYWLQIGRLKFCLVVLTVGMVWAAEALNTVCEILVNMVSPAYSKKAKRAKDVGAAAVLLSSIAAFIIGITLLMPPLCEVLKKYF